MKKVVINRNTWLRGEGSTTSRLLRPSDNKMCCIGFVCKQIGLLGNDIIEDVVELSAIDEELRFLSAPVHLISILEDAYGPNDIQINGETNIFGFETEADRERHITSILRRAEIEVVFIGS